MNPATIYDSEWEWGWKTPLLLSTGALPEPVKKFLTTPLENLDLEHASRHLSLSLAKLKTTRIGIRFERIQEALLSAHADTESLRSGIQIPGITEIDLLQKLKSFPDASIHWEVAVKFYLAVDRKGSTDPDRWIGPSQKDALGIKMRAIWDRQLAVLKDPKIRASLGIPETERIIALPKVHGVLFVPWNLGTSLTLVADGLKCPAGVVAESQRGFWVRESDMDPFLSSIRGEFGNAVRVSILGDRKDWIRDHTHTDSLKEYFNLSSENQGEPSQGAILLDTDSRVREFRFFRVPDRWEESAHGALESLKTQSRIKS